jgi:hypothetical protein
MKSAGDAGFLTRQRTNAFSKPPRDEASDTIGW